MNLHAISPIDGRYADAVAPLRDYLSEWALMRYRVLVETRWLEAMSADAAISHLRPFTATESDFLGALSREFDEAAARRVKSLEAETNHDVKAVEYYIKERLCETSLSDVAESVHFACTSDDINNLAYAMMFRDAMRKVWQPQARSLLGSLDELARDKAGAPMLARTHGQAATPTTLGKEIAVFAHRLRRQSNALESQAYCGKFNGAVGAFNAHHIAYPDANWLNIGRRFVERLGLVYNPLTTQIEPHDWLAELAHGLVRFNTVLLDLCRDMWMYISFGYFRQKAMAGEVGSSTMPHKVNPIDFENAEANLGISSATFAHLALNLPVSRLQRDLSDSSALRNFGVAIAHSYLALLSVQRGLSRVEVDRESLSDDLDEAWEVLAEAVQTIMRKHHLPGAYERMKTLTRGASVTHDDLRDFINALAIPQADKKMLLQLTPADYIGCAEELALGKFHSD
ncbi:MAG: adenylosuccinate lyase [Chloroflexota bacterium]|nr:adenylosuccinate lyase [Chloroflexota bacterium]MDE2907772.1 adenylosuccinate lyase [Chloroflexota bacterium]